MEEDKILLACRKCKLIYGVEYDLEIQGYYILPCPHCEEEE